MMFLPITPDREDKERQSLIEAILALQENPTPSFLSAINQILNSKEIELIAFEPIIVARILYSAQQHGFFRLHPQNQDRLVEELIQESLTMNISKNISLVTAILNVYFYNENDQKAVEFLRKLRLNEEGYIACLLEIEHSQKKYFKEAKYYCYQELVDHSFILEYRLKVDMNSFILEVLNNNDEEENNVTKCKNLLIDFLSTKKRLYFSNINKATVTLEMINFLLYPRNIEQGNKNVCGPASFLYLLLSYSPEKCISAFIELVEKGYSNLIPLKASYLSAYQDQFFSDIFMNALKHASNRILGYNPRFYPSSLELFTGITEPSVMEKWLKQSGFSQVQEAIFLENSNLKWYHHLLTSNGIYSKTHLRFSSRLENFETALAHSSAKKIILMLLSFELCCSLTREKGESRTILNLQADHYVVVKEIQRLSEDQIQLCFWTWGREYLETVQLSDFLAGYKGFITALPPYSHDPQASLGIFAPTD